VQYPGYSETEKTVRHEITMWITRQTTELAWIGIGEVTPAHPPPSGKKWSTWWCRSSSTSTWFRRY